MAPKEVADLEHQVVASWRKKGRKGVANQKLLLQHGITFNGVQWVSVESQTHLWLSLSNEHRNSGHKVPRLFSNLALKLLISHLHLPLHLKLHLLEFLRLLLHDFHQESHWIIGSILWRVRRLWCAISPWAGKNGLMQLTISRLGTIEVWHSSTFSFPPSWQTQSTCLRLEVARNSKGWSFGRWNSVGSGKNLKEDAARSSFSFCSV